MKHTPNSAASSEKRPESITRQNVKDKAISDQCILSFQPIIASRIQMQTNISLTKSNMILILKNEEDYSIGLVYSKDDQGAFSPERGVYGIVSSVTNKYDELVKPGYLLETGASPIRDPKEFSINVTYVDKYANFTCKVTCSDYTNEFVFEVSRKLLNVIFSYLDCNPV